MKVKENERLVVIQKNTDGALYTTGSINVFHQVIAGFIQNIETHDIIKELTASEIIDIFLEGGL